MKKVDEDQFKHEKGQTIDWKVGKEPTWVRLNESKFVRDEHDNLAKQITIKFKLWLWTTSV